MVWYVLGRVCFVQLHPRCSLLKGTSVILPHPHVCSCVCCRLLWLLWPTAAVHVVVMCHDASILCQLDISATSWAG